MADIKKAGTMGTVPADIKPAAKFNPIEFMRETRRELLKVTWPSRNDTMIITMQIVFMAVIAGLFFLAVDTFLGWGISHILGMKQ